MPPLDELVVERAGVEDAPAILKVQRLAYQSEAEIYDDYGIPPLTETLAELERQLPGTIFLKAVHKGRIVGSVRAKLNAATCSIGRLIVDPAFQGQGIGTRLLREIERAFPEAHRYELFTGEKSERNLCLYQREGYSPFRRDAISEGTTLVFLEKPASPRPQAAAQGQARNEGVTMNKADESARAPGRWLRWAGRGLSSAAALFWLLVGAAGAFSEGEPWTAESSLLAGLVLAAALATGVGWRRARLGGLLLTVVGTILCVFGYVTAGRNKWVAVLVSGLPFLAAGALLLAGSRPAHGDRGGWEADGDQGSPLASGG
jgi:GNAT superfamily N-acetyltransferase